MTDMKTSPAQPSAGRIVAASLIGTTIEFYDFYIYGTAATLILGSVFFPPGAPGSQTLAAFLTFGIAFIARALGAFILGHFGDRLGRKTTLVASLLLMGIATTGIGLLPGYGTIGFAAPTGLCLLRMAQGIGLGGEWGGAALLATENAPPGRRALFGMFPQLGPALGFLLSNGLFILIFHTLTNDQFQSWGWRIPFLASAILVAVGLYVRMNLIESAAFTGMAGCQKQAKAPLGEVLLYHGRPLILGSLAMVSSYALFYISTVFTLSYGTQTAHIPRGTFLAMLCTAIFAMAAGTAISSVLADRFGRRPVLLVANGLAILCGFALPVLLGAHAMAAILSFLVISLLVMGLAFGPMGAVLPELFPTRVRYTGASAAYSLGGILGASLAPYAAQRLAAYGGLACVGYYVSFAGAISFLAVLGMRETSARDIVQDC